jgi:hypothetical protein
VKLLLEVRRGRAWPHRPTVRFYFNCRHHAALPRTAGRGQHPTSQPPIRGTEVWIAFVLVAETMDAARSSSLVRSKAGVRAGDRAASNRDRGNGYNQEWDLRLRPESVRL